MERVERLTSPVGDLWWTLADVVAGAALVLSAVPVSVASGAGPAAAAAVGLCGGSVWLRRRAAPVACAVALAGASTFHALTSANSGDLSALFAAVAVLDFYCLGHDQVSERRWLRFGGAFLGLLPLFLLLWSDAHGVMDALVSWVFFIGLPLGAGWFVASRGAEARALLAENVSLERAQKDRIEWLARAERDKVARELHDVVAHSVSVMVIQAAAARSVVERDRGAAKAALQTVERCASEGLAELRHLVGVLHRPEDGAAGIAGSGLAQVEKLVERTRNTGSIVDLIIEGTRRPLAPSLDLAAYRIVQEALTNAVKHAGRDARIEAVITYDASGVELVVTDAGGAPESRPSSSGESVGGRGLIGMRERAHLYGGAFWAGPDPATGGFRIRAFLPLSSESAA